MPISVEPAAGKGIVDASRHGLHIGDRLVADDRLHSPAHRGREAGRIHAGADYQERLHGEWELVQRQVKLRARAAIYG